MTGPTYLHISSSSSIIYLHLAISLPNSSRLVNICEFAEYLLNIILRLSSSSFSIEVKRTCRTEQEVNSKCIHYQASNVAPRVVAHLKVNGTTDISVINSIAL